MISLVSRIIALGPILIQLSFFPTIIFNVDGFNSRVNIVNQIHQINNNVVSFSSSSSRLSMSAVEETTTKNDTATANSNSARIDSILNQPKKEEKRVEVGGMMIKISDQGIYEIETREEHAAFMGANKDKIVLLKFFAPWCRACKGLAPKFIALSKDEKLADLPLVFAEMSISNNKDFVKSLGVLALPSVQFYAGAEGVIENFPCGPSKVPILKKKLIALINERVDAKTRLLTEREPEAQEEETAPCRERSLSIGDFELSEEQISFLRTEIPFFTDFSDVQFEDLISKAKLKSYDSGSVICRQGNPGNNFYVIESGAVEVCIRTGFEDPLTTPSSYTGAVVNFLEQGQYFGERSLITGETRAASIRAVKKTRCFTFGRGIVPTSSILSGEKEATEERLAQIDEKYGVDKEDYVDFFNSQVASANVANQERGSVNTPQSIVGVDTDELADQSALQVPASPYKQTAREEVLLPLLIRFKRVRRASKTFDYISKTKPSFQDQAQIRRRSMLASKLPRTTYAEFKEIWNIIDKNNDGKLSLREMKEFMESVGDEKCSAKLQTIIDAYQTPDAEMSYDTFMGLMAEAEFYFLFTDMFNALDKFDSGYVSLQDLEDVLSGMTDLVSDEKINVIGFEDMNMLVDYEQYSRMLLGAPK